MIKSSDIKYVIVQSGGKGTRMGHYAQNRPKCLIPVNGVPMIVNTMKVYKDKQIIIIGDHLIDVLDSYLDSFCSEYNYKIVRTEEQGTAAGLKKAVSYVPDDEPFILTWSDLFFEEEQNFEFNTELLVGLSDTFKCRWKYDSGFINESSTDCGVSGFFVFRDKSKFSNISTDKSLVRGFLTNFYTIDNISTFYNKKCFEVGEKDRYEELLFQGPNHRYFNKVQIIGDLVYKQCIDPKYDSVHQYEKEWYESVGDKCGRVPKIYSTEPLVLQKIDGKHLWEVDSNKSLIIENYCNALDSLHNIDSIEAKPGECMQVYFLKAYKRVDEVSKIIPFVNRPYININGKDCMNPCYNLSDFEDIISSISNIKKYNVIHGDCSFSNTLVDDKCQIWFIDPRGIFGNTQIYGDRRYDWAKFYYSVSGNYDSINSKKFIVSIFNDQVDLKIQTNGYDHLSDYVISRSGMTKKEMLLINSTIWLSLTGYVKEDIDAVMYAFYKGCELWTQAIYQH
jgi:GTP:adenosylcobinamide-phosphate guanylyltransferase